jgi:2-keto-myo-inositol isomerase
MIERNKFGLNRIICPTLDIKDFFQLANDLGLGYVELRNDLPANANKIIDNYSTQEIRHLSRRYNIQICSIDAIQQFNYLEEIDRVREELKNLLILAQEINCQVLIMCPFNKADVSQMPRSREVYYKKTVLILKELLPLFQQNGLMGYIEPLGFATSSLASIILAMKAIKETGYEGYKIVYDTFHHFLGPDDLNSLSKEYDIKCTGLIHVSAVTAELSPEQYRDEHRNMDFKRDKLKNKEQIDFFVQRGYDGIISFEPFAEEVQKLEVKELRELINQTIEYLS